MSEMFFFLFDLVCFGRYLQFEQYISGIILSFLLWLWAYVFIHIGQLYLPFSNYETVVKQLKADICIRNPLPGNHFDHSCYSLQLVGCKRPFLESNCHYLGGSFKGFYVHPWFSLTNIWNHQLVIFLAARSSPSQGYCAFNNFPVPFSFFRNKKPNPVLVCLHVFYFFFGNKNTPNTDDEGRSSTRNRPKENRRRRNAHFWVKNKCLMQPKHLVPTKNGSVEKWVVSPRRTCPLH